MHEKVNFDFVDTHVKVDLLCLIIFLVHFRYLGESGEPKFIKEQDHFTSCELHIGLIIGNMFFSSEVLVISRKYI